MAIEYGMSSKEFWEDDPDLFWAYRFSYYQREKRKIDNDNFNAWLQGAYIYEAVSVAIGNVLSKQKLYYSKEPYNLYGKEMTKEEQVKQATIELKGRVAQVQALWKNKEEKNS